MNLLRLTSFFLTLFFSLPALAANQVQLDNSTATLMSSHGSVKPGEAMSVGVSINPRDGWHIYWENPGDAGIPTTLEWTLPEGLTVGKVQWPVPVRILEDILAVYGYEDEVLLPVVVNVPADYEADIISVKVNASWLICDDICIPESAELTLDIPTSDTSTQSNQIAQFANNWSRMPDIYGKTLPFTVSDDAIAIELPGKMQENGAYFYVREPNVIAYAKQQYLSGSKLIIPRNGGDVPHRLSGYIEAGDKAYDVEAEQVMGDGAGAVTGTTEPTSNVMPDTPTSKPSDISFSRYARLLAFALIGGLILNLMPCVLPILSLKAIAIAKKSGRERHIIVKQALAYTMGVILSFAAIAALLISLQMAGESIGWGFQMQSPPFVGALAILLFVVGLNLSGMFELPVLFGNTLSDTREHSLRGSFLTGVLAVAVATPCTAPFMATAVGATLTLAPHLAMFVFIFIGIGLALPFLMVALFPRLVSYLPRPGAWMETFKQLMSFPMYASAIWLLWVITQQTGAQGLLVVLVTMLAISFIIWLKGRCSDPSYLCRLSILLLLLAAFINGLVALSTLQPTPMPHNDTDYSAAKLEELRADHTPVLVDATAAWCLTCQVNNNVAIDTVATRAAMEETGTVLMVADWTNRNPEITSFLKSFGYNGVPLYVFYPPGKDPVVLPQLLSESLVIRTIKGETTDD